TGWASQQGLSASKRQDIERALAEIHGSSGTVLGWHARGPLAPEIAAILAARLASGEALPTGKDPAPGWRLLLSAGLDARARLGPGKDADSVWLGYSEVAVADPARVEFLTAGPGRATVWLNGKV